MKTPTESPTKRPFEVRDASETPLRSPHPDQDGDLSEDSINTTVDQGSSTMDITLLRTPRTTKRLSIRTPPPPQTPHNILSPSISNQLSNSHRSRIVIQNPKTPKTIRSNISTPRKSPGEKRLSIRKSPNDRNSGTPSRTNTPKQTPRRQPTTPIILKAMQDGPTPRRNRLLLTPSRNRVNSRYSPKKDLMLLGRLLSMEREDHRKKRKIEKNSARALGSLYDFVSSQSQDSSSSNRPPSQDSQMNSTFLIESHSQSQSHSQPDAQTQVPPHLLQPGQAVVTQMFDSSELAHSSNIVDDMTSTQEVMTGNLDNIENETGFLDNSFIDQQLDTPQTHGNVDLSLNYNDDPDQSRLSTISDKTARRARLSSRLSLETSLPNDSNIAIPEAIIREDGDYGVDLTDELGKNRDESDNPFYDNNDDFYGYDDYDDDDNGDVDNNGDYATDEEENHENQSVTTSNLTRQSIFSDTTEYLDYSLLNQSPLPPPMFVSKRRTSFSSKRPKSQQQSQFSLAMLKNLAKMFVPEDQQRKLQSPESLALLIKISDEFIRQELEDLQSLSKHGKRKGINYDDVRMLISRTQLDPEFDLLNLRDGSGFDDINTEILKFVSTLFDREDVKEIEKVIYASTISDAKKIEQKEAREEKKRLESEQEQEFVGTNDEDDEDDEDDEEEDNEEGDNEEGDNEQSGTDQTNGTLDSIVDRQEESEANVSNSSEMLELPTINSPIQQDQSVEQNIKNSRNDHSKISDDDYEEDENADDIVDIRKFQSDITLNFEGFEDEIVSEEDIDIPIEEDESE